MPETRRQYTGEFREGGVRIVRNTGRPIAGVASELRINAGTLGIGSRTTALAAATGSSWPHATVCRAPGVSTESWFC